MQLKQAQKRNQRINNKIEGIRGQMDQNQLDMEYHQALVDLGVEEDDPNAEANHVKAVERCKARLAYHEKQIAVLEEMRVELPEETDSSDTETQSEDTPVD